MDNGMNQVTPEQLQAAITQIKDSQVTALEHIRASLQSGFEALNDRLDELNVHHREMNGRQRLADQTLSRHDERIKTLFETIRRWDDPTNDDHRGERHKEEKPGVSQRDVRLVAIGGGAVLSVLGFLKVAWPHLMKAFGP